MLQRARLIAPAVPASSPTGAPDDVELLNRFNQRRDDEAFGRLVARHADAIHRTAVRATGNASAAEDVTQATFIVLSRRPRAALISAHCHAGSALPWLVRTARFAAGAWRRSEARRRRHESAAASIDRADPSESGELAEAVAEALSRMSRNERRLITLRHLDEKPWPDVAASLGMTPEAARKATARALVRLRERLGRSGVVVTPSALAVALGMIARPATASLHVTAGTSSAFLIARGVLTMMKIKTAGIAGAALVAAATSVALLGTGAGTIPTAGGTLPAGIPGLPASQDNPDQAAATAPEPFKANEHQPQVTVPGGTRLTLLALGAGEGKWWHADGAKAPSQDKLLPGGPRLASMSVSFDNAESLLDLALLAEPGDPDTVTAGRGAPQLLRVLDGQRQPPSGVGIGMNVQNWRQSWRVMIPASDAQRTDLHLAVVTGPAAPAGTIGRKDGTWELDDDAARHVRVEETEQRVVFHIADGVAANTAVTVVGRRPDDARILGWIEGTTLVFDKGAVGAETQFTVHTRPMVLVALRDLATKAGSETRPSLAVVEGEAMIADAGLIVADVGAGGSRSTVTVQTAGGGGARAESVTGQATATTEGGRTVVRAGGGTVTITGSGRATAVAGGGTGGASTTTRATGSGASGGGSGQSRDDD